MMRETRESAVAESYPTFWEDHSRVSIAQVIASGDAYAAFVNLTEDDLPPERSRDDE